MAHAEDEPECRVCRGEAEDARVLYSPCRCRGSIMFVHQDCLEQWLEHSHKDKCEVCGEAFRFSPLYAPDTPETMPRNEVLLRATLKVASEYVPACFKIALTLCLWFGVLPLMTCWGFRWCMLERDDAADPGLGVDAGLEGAGPSANANANATLEILDRTPTEEEAEMLLAQSNGIIPWLGAAYEWEHLWTDGATGMVIVAVQVASFLVLLSFADFIRFHLVMNRRGVVRVARGQRLHQLQRRMRQRRHQHQQRHRQQRDAAQEEVSVREASMAADAAPGESAPDGTAPLAPQYPLARMHVRHPYRHVAATRFIRKWQEYRQQQRAQEAAVRPFGRPRPRRWRHGLGVGPDGESDSEVEPRRYSFEPHSAADVHEALTPVPRARLDASGTFHVTVDLLPYGAGSRGLQRPFGSPSRSPDDEPTEVLRPGPRVVPIPPANAEEPAGLRRRRPRPTGGVAAAGLAGTAGGVAYGAADAGGVAGSAGDGGAGGNRDPGLVGEAAEFGIPGWGDAAVAPLPESGDEGNESGSNSDAIFDPDAAHADDAMDGAEPEIEADEAGAVPLPPAANADAVPEGDAANAFHGEGPAEEADLGPDLDDMDNLAGFDGEGGPEVELQLAVDELLGFRGPVAALVRNFFYFTAFVCIHGAIFMVLPHHLGKEALGLLAGPIWGGARGLARATISLVPASEELGVWSQRLGALAVAHVLRPCLGFGLQDVRDFLAEVEALGDAEQQTLLLSQLVHVTVGYASVTASVFLIQGVVTLAIRFLSSLRRPPRSAHSLGLADYPGIAVLRPVSRVLSWATAIFKISLLLLMKMIGLPFLLGCVLDVAIAPIHDFSTQERISFTARNWLGTLMIHWEMGITFMLSMTMIVLTLREALHPDWLALVIRPQEPQFGILAALVKESAWSHLRRTTITLLIYLLLLLVFVTVPVRLGRGLFDYAGIPPLRPSIYCILGSELQVPIEVTLFHVVMLSVLDALKTEFANFQTAWLHRCCAALDLTAYLLPRRICQRFARDHQRSSSRAHTITERRDLEIYLEYIGRARAEAKKCHWSLAERHLDDAARQVRTCLDEDLKRSKSASRHPEILDPALAGLDGFRLAPGTDIVRLPRSGDICVVGPPILRPPPFWDDLPIEDDGYPRDLRPNDLERWAWTDEAQPKLQRELAPRSHPKGVAWRLGALLFCGWITTFVVGSLFFAVPMGLGRGVAALAYVPPTWIHDPLCLLLGVGLCRLLYAPFSTPELRVRHGRQLGVLGRWFGPIRWPRHISTYARVFLWFVLIPAIIGVNLDILFFVPWTIGEDRSSLWSQTFTIRTFAAGWVYLNVVVALVFRNRSNFDRRRAGDAQEAETTPIDLLRAREALEHIVQRLSREEAPLPSGHTILDGVILPVLAEVCTVQMAGIFGWLGADLCLRIFWWATQNDVIPLVLELLGPLNMYRFSFIAVAGTRVASHFQAQIDRTYERVHDHIRNDCYVVGTRLRNYEEDVPG